MNFLPFQIITIVANICIFLYVAYYILKLRKKEKILSEKETKIDTNYHQVVNDALSKERKILEDATSEADQILTGAKQLDDTSQKALDASLQKLSTQMQKQAESTAQYFLTNYSAVLHQIANTSLSDIQNTTKHLGGQMQEEMKKVHDSLLPTLQKELDEYKTNRMKQAEQAVTKIVQKASQEVLNKSISLEDHQKLMVEALEKAKKEGLFE
jgi:F0F1-type ATP synthase membrane subunit b/b'